MSVDIDTLPLLTATTGNEKLATEKVSDGSAAALTLRSFTGDSGEENGVFNVVNFGADRTGVVDALPAFNAAVAAAVAAGGGTVFVPPGNYKISDVIKIPSKVHLKGAGKDLSKLVKTAGATAGGGVGAYATVAMVGATNASVENLWVDHATNGALVNGIAMLRTNLSTETGPFCDGCDVLNCRVTGFNSHQYLIWSHGAKNARILFNDVDGGIVTYDANSEQEGIEVFGGENVLVAFNRIVNIGANGIYMGISAGVTGYFNKNVTASHNIVHGCETGVHINAAWDAVGGLNYSENIHLSTNQIYSCHRGHVLIRYATPGAPANSVVLRNIAITDNQINADVLTNNPFTIQYDMQDKSGNAQVQNIRITDNQCLGGKALNTASEPAVAPFQIRYGQGIIVANNQCRNIGAGSDAAFLIHGDGSAIADGVQLTGNIVDNCPRGAVLVRGVQRCSVIGNRFANYYTEGTGSFNAVTLTSADYAHIADNRFKHAGTEIRAIQFDQASTEVTIGENILEYNPSLATYNGDPLQFDQTGAFSANCSRGRAKIAIGATAATLNNSQVQQGSRLSVYQRSGTPQPFRVTLADGQFTITMAAAVAGSDAIFDWEIRQ
ncbi:MAG: hypothetical protein E6Q98_08805 [Rhodospirillaceae bacterium]|nr:MAG: hypothetical protein E6Q98_08805 [Rhodospirillaceae bacterium]